MIFNQNSFRSATTVRTRPWRASWSPTTSRPIAHLKTTTRKPFTRREKANWGSWSSKTVRWHMVHIPWELRSCLQTSTSQIDRAKTTWTHRSRECLQTRSSLVRWTLVLTHPSNSNRTRCCTRNESIKTPDCVRNSWVNRPRGSERWSS